MQKVMKVWRLIEGCRCIRDDQHAVSVQMHHLLTLHQNKGEAM